MGNPFRAVLCAAFTLLLSACNIEIVTLGEGQVTVISNNATACPNNEPCLEAGYNRLVTLHASAKPGYIFTGWAGDCGSTSTTAGTCNVRSLGNKTVVATFKTKSAIVPLMTYSDAFFLSGPWPTDQKRKADGRLDLNGFPFKNTLFEKIISRGAEANEGFARNGAIFVPIATDINPADAKTQTFQSSPTDVVQLINLDSASAHYLQPVAVTVDYYQGDQIAKGNHLRIAPSTGHELDASTRYGLILLDNGDPSIFNLPLQPSAAMVNIINGQAQGALAAHWQRMQSYLSDHTAYQPHNVVAFSLFTTKGQSAKLTQVKDFLAHHNYERALEDGEYIGLFSAPCDYNDAYAERSEIHMFGVYLPFFLQGTPPFLFSGGDLNIDSSGNLNESSSGTWTSIVVSVPCNLTPPAEGYPLEVYATGTGSQIANNFNHGYISTQNHGAIKIYISAPYTSDRVYATELADLGWMESLLGINSSLIIEAVGDFNPFNLAAIEPQYLQYAADMVYAYETGLRMEAYLEMNNWAGQEPSRFRADPNNVTFAGYSLGAIAALHANALSDANKNLIITSMPRPNVAHMNNLSQTLASHFGEDGLDALEWLLGIEFPVNQMDPTLSVLQTTIDAIDTLNFIEPMEDINVMLVMSPFYDDLHGTDTGYSFAKAFDQRFGIRPVFEHPDEQFDTFKYPFIHYIESDFFLYGDEISASPMRVIATQTSARKAVETFSAQMRGTTFSADPESYLFW
jgi:uncharacterized repeat protein (TIGR02543 family)